MSATSIEWCHYTFNPWIGCARVSPGCENCYAETMAMRMASVWERNGWTRIGDGHTLWGRSQARLFAPERYWAQLARWNSAARKAGERRRVFVASMADVFEVHPVPAVAAVQRAFRERLWAQAEALTHLDFLLLTKRPENGRAVLPERWTCGGQWPRNAWLLFSAEDQQRLDERARHALSLPAPVHGVSYEPALGPLDLTGYIEPSPMLRAAALLRRGLYPLGGLAECQLITWVIVGCESGTSARLFDEHWASNVLGQAQAAGIHFFYKQAPDAARRGKVVSLPVLADQRWSQVPEVRQ